MSDPLITVLMPVKEYVEGYLRQAIASVIEQTHPQWRLLIITDPSEAGHFRRLLSEELSDKRIELIINEGVRLAGAFNSSMRAAETEFVAILFGDDLWAPQAVEVLTEQIRAHPHVDFFHSARRIVDDVGNSISSVYPARANVTLEDFLDRAPVKHLLCWRRSKGLACGGMDETSRSVGPDDFDFPWTMAEHGASFQAVDECLYLYRDHRTGFRLSTHLPRSVHERELRRVMEKHGLDERRIRRRLSEARKSYLKTCLYRSSLDRWIKTKLRLPASVYREEFL